MDGEAYLMFDRNIFVLKRIISHRSIAKKKEWNSFSVKSISLRIEFSVEIKTSATIFS